MTEHPQLLSEISSLEQVQAYLDANSETKIQVLVVNFPERVFAFPVDGLQGSMFEAFVRFNNEASEEEDPPSIITYECKEWTKEEFSVVAKLLHHDAVEDDALLDRAECINYFLPVAKENLLCNLNLVSCPNGKNRLRDVEDEGVIVCENENRTAFLQKLAKALQLDSYVPFRLFFMEGENMGYSRTETSVDLNTFKSTPMTPAALVIGDYNHVFCMQKFQRGVDKLKQTLKDFHEQAYIDIDGDDARVEFLENIFPKSDSSFCIGNHVAIDRLTSEYHNNFSSHARGVGLKLVLGQGTTHRKLFRYISYGTIDPDHFTHMVHHVDSDRYDEESAALFHRDGNGKVTFSKKEAAAASAFIADCNLDGRVLSYLQEKPFDLSLSSHQYKMRGYVGGSIHSLVCTTGLLKLDASAEPPFKGCEKFDAWPSSEYKEDRKERLRRDDAPGRYF